MISTIYTNMYTRISPFYIHAFIKLEATNLSNKQICNYSETPIVGSFSYLLKHSEDRLHRI